MRARLSHAIRENGMAVMVAIVLLIAVLGGVETYRADRADQRQREETRELADCLSRYGDAVADAIRLRSEANIRAEDAQFDLFLSIFNAPQTDAGRAQARKVFGDYLEARRRAKEDRQNHPYPDPPRVTCTGK
jgi:hypothetical protein